MTGTGGEKLLFLFFPEDYKIQIYFKYVYL